MFAVEKISGLFTTLHEKPVVKHLGITLLAVGILTVFAISLSQIGVASVSGVDRTITYSASIAVPMNILLGALFLATPLSVEEKVTSPMSGKCTLKVKEGDDVEKGDVICTVEAMKMEVVVRATVAGKISGIPVEDGALLQANQTIARIASSQTGMGT